MYAHWDEQAASRAAGSAGSPRGDACGEGEVRAESFDAMEGSLSAARRRPLPFEDGKHALLEPELKALYCALTRARINVWIVDFDVEKRDPAFEWFRKASRHDENQ